LTRFSYRVRNSRTAHRYLGNNDDMKNTLLILAALAG